MWYLGGYVFLNDPTKAAAAGEVSRSGAGYFAMVCVYLYGLIYCATWQGITWVYCSEIFPLDIRMLCVALTTADQWLWSFIISRTTPYMITSLGYGTYFVSAPACLESIDGLTVYVVLRDSDGPLRFLVLLLHPRGKFSSADTRNKEHSKGHEMADKFQTKGKTLEDMEPIFGALPPLNVEVRHVQHVRRQDKTDTDTKQKLEEEGDLPLPKDEKFGGTVTYLETTDTTDRGRRSRSRTPEPRPLARIMSS